MDRNQNGMLEPDEYAGRMQQMVERMATDAKLDLKRPIPIAKLEEAMENARSRFSRDSGRGSERDGGSRSREESSGRDRSANSKPAAEPLVPGFGEPSDLPPVPGFDTPAPTSADGDSSSSTRSGDSRDDDSDYRGDSDSARSGSSSGRREFDRPSSSANTTETRPASTEPSAATSTSVDNAEKTRRYAASMFKKYDADQDGYLNESEMADVRAVDNKADTNGDKLVSQAEFEAAMMARAGISSQASSSARPSSRSSSDYGSDRSRSDRYSSGRSERGRSESGYRGRGRSTGSATYVTAEAPLKTINGHPTRFRTAAERLPEGLPSWFALKDTDGDGQVSMAEFSRTWSESKLREFQQLDPNNDGVITPAECLANAEEGDR